MNKEISTGLVIILSVVTILLFMIMVTVSYVWGSYNTFVIAKQDINNQWSNVKTEYQRRADLVNNLVEVTKGYAKFESETLIKVTEARSGKFGVSQDEEMQNLNSLDSAISRLLVVMEKYPELKSIEQYNKLSEELKNTENRIQIARTDYNSLIRSYNILVSTFPRTVVASWFGYKELKFFDNNKGNDASISMV